MTEPSFRIGKLEAARRQLHTAISLWFNDGDSISIHTLAFAAYEVIHSISQKRDPARPELIFDNKVVDEKYRKDFDREIRKHANFFKHADRDGDSVIIFKPRLSEFFIQFAIIGLEICGERESDEESAFLLWLQFHRPHLFNRERQKLLSESLSPEVFQYLRALPKREFFERMLKRRGDQLDTSRSHWSLLRRALKRG